jgi:hypothetical protein
MDKQQRKLKSINQTFSIPTDVSQDLHQYVKRREMSRFVTDAIRKELIAIKLELKKQYLEAEKDPGQIEVRNEWDITVADDSDDW